MAVKLKRSVSLSLLVLYGLGTMVGAGFYALIGKIAENAGYFTPISFLISGALALLTAFSYAELSSRYPYSAGEAYYAEQAFHRRWLTTLTGLFVIFTGVMSAATLIVATQGFIQDVFPFHQGTLIFILAITLGLIAAWGIGESLKIVAVITVIEVGTLFYIFIINTPNLTIAPLMDISTQAFHPVMLNGIFLGAFLAVYAFIGFEDMVNIAEEVKDVRRNLPKGILICIIVTTFLYIFVSWAALSAVGPDALASSLTPLATVMAEQGKTSEWSLRIVSLLTGINGALVQFIMASRVAYGMAKLGQVPKWLGDVNSWTRTPLKATFAISLIILVLALFVPLIRLAETTSGVILLVFVLVNLSLVVVKFRQQSPPQKGVKTYPLIIPILGAFICLLFLIIRLFGISG